MSIIVRGMEMPKNCGSCPLRRINENRAWCYRTGEYIDFNKEFDGRKNNCPLIEVPPHGRLIDADAIQAHEIDIYGKRLRVIDEAKTVIEAEGGEE